MSDRKCPLGDDCDLTVAWMAGQQEARDSFRARINQLEVQLGLARTDADAQRARAEAAEDRCRELSHKLDELDFLHHEGGPRSVAAMEEALMPFAAAWGIATATGISRMAYLSDIARGEVSGVHFMRARAALGKATP